MTFFDPHHKRETVQLFIYNLLWGKVRIECEKFGSKEEGLRYADEIYKNIDLWDGESLCPSIEHEATINKIVTQLYDAIIKGRTYGAIIGEIHDKGYEARIQELEDANKNKGEEIRNLQSENTQLAQALYQLKTSEPPIKKDFKAMG